LFSKTEIFGLLAIKKGTVVVYDVSRRWNAEIHRSDDGSELPNRDLASNCRELGRITAGCLMRGYGPNIVGELCAREEAPK
jgi:hypothetical protein